MLNINKPQIAPVQNPVGSEFLSLSEIYDASIGFIRRQYSVILIVLFAALVLGVIYIFTTPSRYTAHAVIVIDTHKSQFFQAQTPLGDLPIDSATVDTQIEILNSDNIALSVINNLRLDNEPEFTSAGGGLIGFVLGSVIGVVNKGVDFFLPNTPRTGEPSSEAQTLQRALNTFRSHLAVKRVNLTYAIQIDFQSLDPDRAAQVANAVADAYVVDALEAKYQTTRRAAVWLQDRLKELREQSTNAERAVVDYKTKNNIVESGGQLMNEQQLAELNSSLIQAQATTAEAKARLDRVQQIIAAGDIDPAAAATATVADSLRNEVITKLRQQYLEYNARKVDWEARYGYNHLAVVNLRNQMRELRRSIFDELQRIAETYKSDHEIAEAREVSVKKSLDQIVSQSQSTNEAEVTLHNLESNSQTYRALYDNFLQRYMESVQQQTFPVSESRLITQATSPLTKSSPKSLLVLALASLGGLIFGAGVGALRDISDRVFRTTAQVRQYLQTDCISVVPLMKDATPAKDLGGAKNNDDSLGLHLISRDQSVLWTVVNEPLSRFSESIRAIKVAADIGNVIKSNKVIGITSAVPNEGKSTIAFSLAQTIAQGGARVALVDCDLRNPSLSRKLAPDTKSGLLEVISGNALLQDIIWTQQASEFAFLPVILKSRVSNSSEILASQAMKTFFAQLREAYEYVILDLSPLAPVVDVRAMTHLVDSFVLIVEWGHVKIDVVEHALSNSPSVFENLLGVVLNKTDMNSFSRYDKNQGSYYYNHYYSRYGYTD